jgi:hypothetical protein
MSQQSNNIQLEQGQQVSLRIKQTEYVATAQFKAQDVVTRKCRFSDENPGGHNIFGILSRMCIHSFILFSVKDSIFLTYSQKSCRFECALKDAIDAVGCLPWDYPIPIKNGVPIDVEVCLSHAQEYNKLERFHQGHNLPEG